MHVKSTEITEQTIKQLVDSFYNKISIDPNLSPIFNAAIGKERAGWDPHLEKMYDFWSSIMLESKRYNGNPLKKHKEILAFDIKLFDRWLELFAETAQDLCAPHIANKYINKSKMIAARLKLSLYSQ